MYTVSICRDESGTVGLEIEDDCYVAAITPAGPAALAGIEVGGFISAVNGIQVGSKADIVAVLGKTKQTRYRSSWRKGCTKAKAPVPTSCINRWRW
eukprot:COSAG01_NODE_6531_length_3618_cov_1.658710_2_plen_96_part_00